jgi:hypothetical protein
VVQHRGGDHDLNRSQRRGEGHDWRMVCRCIHDATRVVVMRGRSGGMHGDHGNVHQPNQDPGPQPATNPEVTDAEQAPGKHHHCQSCGRHSRRIKERKAMQYRRKGGEH